MVGDSIRASLQGEVWDPGMLSRSASHLSSPCRGSILSIRLRRLHLVQTPGLCSFLLHRLETTQVLRNNSQVLISFQHLESHHYVIRFYMLECLHWIGYCPWRL